MPTGVVDLPPGVVSCPTPYLALPETDLCAPAGMGAHRLKLRRHFGTQRSLGGHVEPPSSPIT